MLLYIVWNRGCEGQAGAIAQHRLGPQLMPDHIDTIEKAKAFVYNKKHMHHHERQKAT